MKRGRPTNEQRANLDLWVATEATKLANNGTSYIAAAAAYNASRKDPAEHTTTSRMSSTAKRLDVAWRGREQGIFDDFLPTATPGDGSWVPMVNAILRYIGDCMLAHLRDEVHKRRGIRLSLYTVRDVVLARRHKIVGNWKKPGARIVVTSEEF